MFFLFSLRFFLIEKKALRSENLGFSVGLSAFFAFRSENLSFSGIENLGVSGVRCSGSRGLRFFWVSRVAVMCCISSSSTTILDNQVTLRVPFTSTP